jgi:hypothetical protein
MEPRRVSGGFSTILSEMFFVAVFEKMVHVRRMFERLFRQGFDIAIRNHAAGALAEL